MTVSAEIDTRWGWHVAGVADCRLVVVEIAITDFVGKISTVRARVVAASWQPIHVTLQARWVVATGVVANGAIFYVSTGHLSVTTSTGPDGTGQGPPVGATMPYGAHTLILSGVVTFGAEVTAIDFMTREAVGGLAACFDAVQETEVQAVNGIDRIHCRPIKQWCEGGMPGGADIGQLAQLATGVTILAVSDCMARHAGIVGKLRIRPVRRNPVHVMRIRHQQAAVIDVATLAIAWCGATIVAGHAVVHRR